MSLQCPECGYIGPFAIQGHGVDDDDRFYIIALLCCGSVVKVVGSAQNVPVEMEVVSEGSACEDIKQMPPFIIPHA